MATNLPLNPLGGLTDWLGQDWHGTVPATNLQAAAVSRAALEKLRILGEPLLDYAANDLEFGGSAVLGALGPLAKPILPRLAETIPAICDQRNKYDVLKDLDRMKANSEELAPMLSSLDPQLRLAAYASTIKQMSLGEVAQILPDLEEIAKEVAKSDSQFAFWASETLAVCRARVGQDQPR